jgi:3-phosphoglycerate kinase
VNNAFGLVHRARAWAKCRIRFAKQNVIVFLIEKEWEFLGSTIAKAKHFFIVTFGGPKVHDKVSVRDDI